MTTIRALSKEDRTNLDETWSEKHDPISVINIRLRSTSRRYMRQPTSVPLSMILDSNIAMHHSCGCMNRNTVTSKQSIDTVVEVVSSVEAAFGRILRDDHLVDEIRTAPGTFVANELVSTCHVTKLDRRWFSERHRVVVWTIRHDPPTCPLVLSEFTIIVLSISVVLPLFKNRLLRYAELQQLTSHLAIASMLPVDLAVALTAEAFAPDALRGVVTPAT